MLNKITAFLCIWMLGWTIGLTQAHAAGEDPVPMLQHIADNMLAGLKANQASLKNKPQVVYRLANQYVVPYAALPEMSKRVLPPQTWHSATPAQRAQFQKEFTTTLIRTYASALSSYNNQTIKFYPIRGAAGNVAVVKSQIISPDSQTIDVSYQVIQTPKGWRLMDLVVEGVGMLDSFRSQFADILSQGSMNQLLDRMANHNRGQR